MNKNEKNTVTIQNDIDVDKLAKAIKILMVCLVVFIVSMVVISFSVDTSWMFLAYCIGSVITIILSLSITWLTYLTYGKLMALFAFLSFLIPGVVLIFMLLSYNQATKIIKKCGFNLSLLGNLKPISTTK